MLVRLVETLLFPPFSLILLGLAGVLIMRFNRRLGAWTVVLAFAVLYIASTPLVENLLVRSLQTVAPLESVAMLEPAEAIVVLGAGAYRNAPEYGEPSLGGSALERLRYGVWLHRRTGIPILVTGGTPLGVPPPEADIMARILLDDYGIAARWVENRSDNTRQNALYSAEILLESGISTIALVTHTIHMPRARSAFENAGLSVIPAATKYSGTGGIAILDFFPKASALSSTANSLHEWLGRAWYEISD